MIDAVNLDELEALARAKLDVPSFGYIRSGAEDERTLGRNRDAFGHLQLLPRYLVDVSSIDLGIELLGTRLSMPVLLAPTGFQVLAHPDGELASVRASADAGTVFVSSTLSSHGLEDIARASDGARWFQLYCARDRSITETLVLAAAQNGYRALCLTIDVPALGRREDDLRNQLALPPAALPQNILRFLDLDRYTVAERNSAVTALVAQLFDPSLTWDDLDWLRGLSDLPLVIKGILAPEDAARAADAGVDAIVVSNHGGRQLDGVPAAIEMLDEVLDAVDGRCPVLIDGGIRRGTDVVKALALGAAAVLIGRPYVWGLAAAGQSGVAHALSLLRNELETAMALVGRRRVADLDRSLIRRPRR